MAISAREVKELRDRTQAGFGDCKKALEATEGDITKAVEWLRKKGLSDAGKKAGRVAAEGVVHSYIHAGGKIGVLVEVNCETDFVARGEDFQGFVREVAMHIAAADPRYLRSDEIPESDLNREREIFKAQVIEQGKPAKIADKIVEGKIGKWYSEVCLLDQPWVKEPKMTVEDLRTEIVQKTGENVQVRRFVRYALGEGIEKKQDNLAEEVAKMTAAAAEKAAVDTGTDANPRSEAPPEPAVAEPAAVDPETAPSSAPSPSTKPAPKSAAAKSASAGKKKRKKK